MNDNAIGVANTSEHAVASSLPVVTARYRRLKKTLAMYCTMVAVSTCAIFFLEHASLLGAFRTALVAAIGKTFAANWVSGLFD